MENLAVRSHIDGWLDGLIISTAMKGSAILGRFETEGDFQVLSPYVSE
jgi:hypothetical protein